MDATFVDAMWKMEKRLFEECLCDKGRWLLGRDTTESDRLSVRMN